MRPAARIFSLCIFFISWIAASGNSVLGQEEESAFAPIQGLILADSFESLYPRNDGVHCFNLSLPLKEQEKLSGFLEERYLGKELSIESFETMKSEIASFYAKKGQPFVRVTVPEQEVTDGVVIVNIEEGRLGKVSVEGAHWFSSDWYRSSIRCKEGDLLNIDELQADVSWMDRNPFRSVEVICKQGTISKTTNVDLIVKDKRPIKVSVGTDNTGFKQDGYQRAYASVCVGNLFSLGQIFSYQYTAGYDFKLFQSHIGSYEIPCFWRHLLSFFGGVSFVRSPLESTGSIRSHGNSFQASSRYTVPFAQGGRFPQEIRVGCDFKRMNNNVIFGGETVSSKNVDLLQFLLEYKLSYFSPKINHHFSIEAVLSPGPLLPDMSKSSFDVLRPGAGPNYFYVRGGLKETFKLPKRFALDIDFAFQYSTDKLLASEQFGLGGYTTVRGYQERAVNADSGLLLRIEPRFPVISIPRKSGSLAFFLFSDFGMGLDQLKLGSNYRTNQALWGIGPGFRYNYKNNICMRFDWGYQLTNIQNNPAGHNRINFGASVSL